MRRAHAALGLTATCLVSALLLGLTPGVAAARHRGHDRPAHPDAASTFRPRIGAAMGIVPRLGSGEIAAGTSPLVVYHGGSVMRDVTVHTIFWAPAGYRFDGSPTPGTLGYEPLIQQFLADAAHDSGTTGNVFSTLAQYHDSRGPGVYQISYDPAVDSIDSSAPYPPRSRQCASPAGVAACVTDLELQQEIDAVIDEHDPGGRGLSNLWFVFLPPDVDTCTEVGQCASNVYAGYHAASDLGHGLTVYVAVPDPLLELTPSPGSDPEGNPEAESSIDTVAHETEEAITDPVGTGWMDPNGYEAADKCENGPEQGTPLGYAADGSPYNQLIDGHPYLLQDMWSNAAAGCVQSSTATGSALPLPAIDLRQYSSAVSGSIGVVGRRVRVLVQLIRAGTVVAVAAARTRSDGGWGPAVLRSGRGVPHAVGDDRDVLEVTYGHGGPSPDLIATGDGGDPFTASGFTGWFDLDNGYAVSRSGVAIGPCSQTGVLSLRVGRSRTEPPAELCGTESDAAIVSTPPIGPATSLTLSSEDNRAELPLTPNGALVKLTIALGEPDSASALGNDQVLFGPSGHPSCTALLRIQQVRCSGLVPGARYTLAHRRTRAGDAGVVDVRGVRLAGGELLTLSNRAGRRLTTLHVAHLRVHIDGDQTRIASGRCQAGDYYGAPLSHPPTSDLVGDRGAGGLGTICPLSGRAAGLPTRDIAQTDDLSGGQTVTQVPSIESTAPLQDETLYGAFIASAQSGLPGRSGSVLAAGVPVALTITRAASQRRVFFAPDVDTRTGVSVPALAPGQYLARWVLRDANGDTRTVLTRFVEEA